MLLKGNDHLQCCNSNLVLSHHPTVVEFPGTAQLQVIYRPQNDVKDSFVVVQLVLAETPTWQSGLKWVSWMGVRMVWRWRYSDHFSAQKPRNNTNTRETHNTTHSNCTQHLNTFQPKRTERTNTPAAGDGVSQSRAAVWKNSSSSLFFCILHSAVVPHKHAGPGPLRQPDSELRVGAGCWSPCKGCVCVCV